MTIQGQASGAEGVRVYSPDTRVLDQNAKAFRYHPPHSDQLARYVVIREAGATLADLMVHVCPGSRELSLALTNLEQAVMWANAAIARNEASVE